MQRLLSRSLVLLPALAAAAPLGATPFDSFEAGAVYTSTNDPAGNQVVVYSRAKDGTVTLLSMVATGGTGTGMGLGNQGAVVLSTDERWLYVVNAGSNDLSVFRVREDGLDLIDIESVGGTRPVSVAQHDEWVFVVNAGSNSIAGFRQAADGGLDLIQGSRRRLSRGTTAPAQISFSNDGQDLYVSEKATDTISHYRLNQNGIPTSYESIPSLGPTPFGFAFGLREQLIVSEAAGGAPGASTATSYRRNAQGGLDPITSSLSTGESAICWIVVTPEGRLAYGSNTASSSVTSFRVAFDGTLTLLDPQAASTGMGPTDMALTRSGEFFYVLNTGAGSIGDYKVEPTGALTSLPGSNSGLPAFATGLAAR